MSRHDFHSGDTRLSIGWDAPLASFFLQIWTGDGQDEDEQPSIWLGAFYGEVRAPDPLIVIAHRHIPDLPATLHRQLTIDQLGAPARPRRPGLIDP
ncbi:hypothetical protein [Sphingomonas sp. BK481]|uniref:hypothetical protein n=1 Tax=Sphingomonas sp. BK481 TaxID=2586981 RepID=UPI001622166B|nr:hypothetical protein [Sphingomonas sp. BK481]MBB3589003.1 hypothetical protein [Sphingomonas sp. BK481]